MFLRGCRAPSAGVLVAIAGTFHCVSVAGAQTPPRDSLRAPDAVLSARFTNVTGVRELSDGRVIVSDSPSGPLVVVDFDNDLVSVVAPLQSTGNIVPLFPLPADSSVMINAAQGRWVFLEGARVVGTLGASHPLVNAIRSAHGADDRGFVLSVRAPSTTGGLATPNDSTLLLLLSRPAAVLDTVGRLRSSPASSATSPPPTLSSYEVAQLTADGWIAVARLDPYTVDWRTPDGTWRRGRELPVPLDSVGDREKEALRSSLRADQHFDAVDWPATLPPFRGPSVLWVTADEKALVRRTNPVGVNRTLYDVVNRGGEFERQIVLPPEQHIVGFGAQSVYVVETEQSTTRSQLLRRHPWP